MVPQGGESLNSLFEELADWEEQLKGLGEEISILHHDQPGGPEL